MSGLHQKFTRTTRLFPNFAGDADGVGLWVSMQDDLSEREQKKLHQIALDFLESTGRKKPSQADIDDLYNRFMMLDREALQVLINRD
ncbi:hypothetical protein [Synechococcus sp. MIT S1220]|uniref:hypothetical protein n=1 Tax=Synechococcus sp. MIT S1220 TaxID=3082549 RepID=UPI0039B03C25